MKKLCVAYILREADQTDEDLARLKDRLEQAYLDGLEPHGFTWDGFLVDEAHSGLDTLDQRMGWQMLFGTIGDLDPGDELYVLVRRRSDLACGLADASDTILGLVGEAPDITIRSLGPQRDLQNDTYCQRLCNALAVCSSWEEAFDERAQNAPPPPKEPTPLTATQNKRLVESEAAVALIVQLRDQEKKSWTDVWRRITADGFRTATGGEWGLSAIKGAYRKAKAATTPGWMAASPVTSVTN